MSRTIPICTTFTISDLGKKRKQNQDAVLARPDLGLYSVADGMGGHQGGETASRLCIESLIKVFENESNKDIEPNLLLVQGIQLANQTIFETASNQPELRGMGTTVSAIAFSGRTAWLAQVGDSRCYYFSDAGFWQLTRDHSMVQEKLRAGLITRSQLKTDQMRNVITRSVGVEPNVRVDLFEFPVMPGDAFLICSDGLSGPLEDAEIFDTLQEDKNDPAAFSISAKSLVAQSNARGGDDNVSIVLVKVN